MSKHWKPPSVVASYAVAKLVPKLKYRESVRPARLRNPEGLLGRLKILRKTVTALFRDERIELNHPKALEARGQAERLIVEAIRNGPSHGPTMELADFWLEEKQLVHKLFKVLVPRYQNYDKAFTSLYMAPRVLPGNGYERAILELRGNPFPPVQSKVTSNYLHLHNILLNEARREFKGERSLEESNVHEMSTSFPENTEIEKNLTNMISKLDLTEEPSAASTARSDASQPSDHSNSKQ